jgi:PAS domain-containing protein
MQRIWIFTAEPTVTSVDTLVLIVALQAAAIVALLVRERRRSRTDQLLRESEERFRRMVDRAPVMLWTARPDTTLGYLNGNCIEFTGLPIEKLRDDVDPVARIAGERAGKLRSDWNHGTRSNQT